MTGTGIAWTGTPAVLSAEGVAVLARLFRGRWDAAVRAGLPAVVPGMTSDPKGGDPEEWPDYLRVRQWPGARS